MTCFEIRVTIDRPLSEVFATYTQSDVFRWTNLRSVHWAYGKPWEVGSRLRIETDGAYSTVVDQLLTNFEPNRFVGYISHFGGVTMQSQVHFRALSDTQTVIETQLEFVGRFSRFASLPLKSTIEQATQRIYEDLKRECERTVTRKPRRRSTRVPLKVEIEARGIEERSMRDGETIIVSCHGALISTVVPLQVRMRIEVRVILTEKRALACVVHRLPGAPRLCGIELADPHNIWGLSWPPDDWLAHDLQFSSGLSPG